jgi:Protein of unknown function (DUF3592)
MAPNPGNPPELRKRSLASKMFQAAVIVVLLAAVAGCDLYAVQILRRFEVSRHWLSVTGVMRDFRVQRNGRDPQKAKYVVDCGYRFTVNGATFAATNRMPEKFPNAFDADKWVAALRAKGGYITVFYNPQDPAKCVLSRGLPDGVMPCLWILGIVSVGGAGWFGRRLVRLVAGKEDFVAVVVRPVVTPDDSAPSGESGAVGVANVWQKIIRWFFALLGAMSCWWMAVLLYRDWGLPATERILPSVELIFVMEFIMAHSGATVSGMLADPNENRKAKVYGVLILGAVYMVFAVTIAAAGHSARLFVTFSGILISRWVGLFLDSDKARQQQYLRSMETFLILFLSLIVCLVFLHLPFEVMLMVYFGLIGIYELTLPGRKRSFLGSPTVGGT